MSETTIRYEVEAGVATITFDRPEQKNTFTAGMGDEIWEAFCSANEDDDVRVIVVTGSGRVFCGGIDLDALASPVERERISTGPFFREFPKAVHASPKPSICAMNGHAMGVGVTMALSFDVRIAASDARLTMPFTKLGLIAGFGANWFLPRLIGRSRSLELLYTGRSVLGSEAADIGLVNLAVPHAELAETAREMATTIAGSDPIVIEYCKRALGELPDLALSDAMAGELQLFNEMQATRAEHAEQ